MEEEEEGKGGEEEEEAEEGEGKGGKEKGGGGGGWPGRRNPPVRNNCMQSTSCKWSSKQQAGRLQATHLCARVRDPKLSQAPAEWPPRSGWLLTAHSPRTPSASSAAGCPQPDRWARGSGWPSTPCPGCAALDLGAAGGGEGFSGPACQLSLQSKQGAGLGEARVCVRWQAEATCSAGLEQRVGARSKQSRSCTIGISAATGPCLPHSRYELQPYSI